MLWICYVFFTHEFGGTLNERVKDSLSSDLTRGRLSEIHLPSGVFRLRRYGEYGVSWLRLSDWSHFAWLHRSSVTELRFPELFVVDE